MAEASRGSRGSKEAEGSSKRGGGVHEGGWGKVNEENPEKY